LDEAGQDAIAEWTVPAGWTTTDGLATDGSNDPATWVVPPLSVTGTTDYAVTFTFTVTDSGSCPRTFGVAIRGSAEDYLAGGIRWKCDPMAILWAGQDQLATAPITVTEGTHTVTVAAQGTNLSLALDGSVIVSATTDRAPSGETIGFWSDGVALTITNVTVTDLTTLHPEATPA